MRVRGRSRCQMTRPPSPPSVVERMVGSPPPLSPLFLGYEFLTQSHSEKQGLGLHGAVISSAPKPSLPPFTFTFLEKPAGGAKKIPALVR